MAANDALEAPAEPHDAEPARAGDRPLAGAGSAATSPVHAAKPEHSSPLVEVHALIDLIARTPRSMSGFTLARPSDFQAAIRHLRAAFARNRTLLRRQSDAADDYLHCVERLERTLGQSYPNEAIRLAVLKTEMLLECGAPARALASIEHVAQRPYLVEGDLRLLLNVLAGQQRALLAMGRHEEASSAAWRGLRFVAAVAPRRAGRAFREFVGALHIAPADTGPPRGLAGCLAALARLHVRLDRESGSRLMRRQRKLARLAVAGIGKLAAVAIACAPAWLSRLRGPDGGGESGCDVLVTRAMGGAGDIIMLTPGLHALARRTGRPVHLAIKRSFFPLLAGNPDVVLHDIDAGRIDTDAFAALHNLSFCPCARYESRRRPHVGKGRVELFAMGMGVSSAELRASGLKPRLFLDAESLRRAETFFQDHGLIGPDPVIGVQPFSRESYRDYPRMLALIEQLAARFKVVVFHQSPLPLPRHPAIVPAFGRPLAEAVATLSRCDLVLCVDTAFLHVAAALDLPTVALFGPTDGRTVARHHPGATVVSLARAFKCAPCWRNEDMSCRLGGGHESACLAAIGEPEILRAVEERLQAAAAEACPLAVQGTPRWRRWCRG